MKTTETSPLSWEAEIKAEIIRYIKETSKHVFLYSTDTQGNRNYFTVRLSEDNETIFIQKGQYMNSINIDSNIKYHLGNAKCIIKHQLFLDNCMTAAKQNKYVKAEIEEATAKNLIAIKEKIEREKQQSILRAKEAEERAKAIAERLYREEHALYLKLKAKFEL